MRGVRFLISVLASASLGIAHAGNPDAALCKAAERNNVKKALEVLDRGADVNTRCWWGRTPLHEAARHRQGDDLVRRLVEFGADVDARDSSDQTPLHAAMSVSKARVLIEAGGDVNAADASGSTPIVTAVIWEDLDLIRYLLDCGADAALGDRRAFDVNIAHTRDHARRRQIHTMLSEARKGQGREQDR